MMMLSKESDAIEGYSEASGFKHQELLEEIRLTREDINAVRNLLIYLLVVVLIMATVLIAPYAIEMLNESFGLLFGGVTFVGS